MKLFGRFLTTLLAMIRRPISQSVASPTPTERPILVAVRNACEEIVAGLGNALVSVRTLDGLSFDVRAGELLLLIGGVASGATSLLGALYGPPASRARAQRYVTPGVQLRRATIPFSASEALIAGWSDAHHAPRTASSSDASNAHSRGPVVYLLRVRPDDATRAASCGAITTHSWREWAGALQRCGGAIVLARHGSAPNERVEHEQRAPGRGALPDFSMVRESSNRDRSHVRTLTLHAGQFVSADRQWAEV